jgi:cardiolipin synthase
MLDEGELGAAITRANDVELYADGSAGLDAMLAALRCARRQVHLETYILRNDATGRRFLDALAEASHAGVRTRLLCDAFGARGVDRRARRQLRNAGVETAVFNPLLRVDRAGWRHRDHRKLLVVDGALAFTGGLNLADECHAGHSRGRAAPLPWRDVHARIRGPAVAQLAAVFAESWAIATGRRPEPCGLPTDDAPGGESLAVLPDGPGRVRGRLHEVIHAALARSRERVLLATPYFLPGASLKRALLATASRGVRVEVLIAGDSDHPLVARAVRDGLADYRAAGVRVHACRGALMHAKAAVFDERLAIFGTSNLDQQSLRHSYEVNVAGLDGALPRRLEAILRCDVARSEDASAHGPRTLPGRVGDRCIRGFIERL